jgi:hypothetical protein
VYANPYLRIRRPAIPLNLRFRAIGLPAFFYPPLFTRHSALTLLDATLTRTPASIDSTGLTENLSPLKTTLIKKPGEGVRHPALPNLKFFAQSRMPRTLVRKEMNFHFAILAARSANRAAHV